MQLLETIDDLSASLNSGNQIDLDFSKALTKFLIHIYCINSPAMESEAHYWIG